MPLRHSAPGRPPALDDPTARDVLGEHAEVLRELRGQPLLDGHLIESITITSGSRAVVKHGLSRKLRGYLVVRKNANAVVYDETASDPKSELWLQASATVTVNLWVF